LGQIPSKVNQGIGRITTLAAVRGGGRAGRTLGPAHIVKHLSVMTDLDKQGRYDRMTDDLFKLTGQEPISMHDFVKLHAAEFTRSERSA
jgi:hypothetical protein